MVLHTSLQGGQWQTQPPQPACAENPVLRAQHTHGSLTTLMRWAESTLQVRKLRLREVLCPRQPQQVSSRPGTWSRDAHPSTQVLIKHNAQRMGVVGERGRLWAGGSQEASLAEGRRGETKDHEEPECQGQDAEVGFLPRGKEPPVLQAGDGAGPELPGSSARGPRPEPRRSACGQGAWRCWWISSREGRLLTPQPS